MRHIALALTGASGIPYFLRLLERLDHRSDITLHLLATQGGKRVMTQESGVKWPPKLPKGSQVHDNKDIGACIASGSFRLESMVILPCSMNTLAAVAMGLAGNLVQRCAAVQLKENRRLILVPRETPLSVINIKAMLAVKEAGAILLPASPGFYQKPESILDLVDTVVDRILDHLHIDDSHIKRWLT